MAGPELQATIGADASDLIRETKDASRAWSRFTTGLIKEGGSAGKAFTGISKGAKDLTRGIGETASALRRLDFKGVTSGAKGLASSIGSLAANFGSLGLSVAKIGFSAIASGAQVALTALKGLAVGVGLVSVALVGIGVKAVAEFSKFETAFAQVRTLVDESKVDIKALETGVRGLAVTYGVDLKQATLAAYQAISAGVDPARTVEFLQTAFKGAAAGAADVAEVTDLVTSALNAFNKPVEEAARVSDIFFTTVRLGKTTITELSQNFGQVGPIAAAAGVALSDVGAAFAALTASGVNTAEAATQIKATLTGIVKPAGAAQKALAAIGVNADLLKEKGLEEVFKRLRAATGGSTEKLAEFLPNIRALQGAAVLAGVGFDKFNKSLAETRNSAGATGEAFAKVEKNLSVSFGRLKASINDTFVSIGKLIQPIVRGAADALTQFRDGTRADFDSLAEAFDKRFGPSITKFFTDLGGSSAKSGSAVAKALRTAGDALQTFGNFVRQNAEVLGGFAATFQALGKTVIVVARSVQTVAGLAFLALSLSVEAALQAVTALAEGLGLDLAGPLRSATDVVSAFNSELGNRTQEAAEAAANALVSFGDVGKTFDKVTGSAESFGRGLLRASDAAKTLAVDVDAARKATAGQVAASAKAAAATAAVAKAAQGTATAQKEMAATAGQAGAAAGALAVATQAATTKASELFREVSSGSKTFEEASAQLGRFRDQVGASSSTTVTLSKAFAQLSGAAGETKESAERLGGVLKALGVGSDAAAAKTIKVTTSATELFNAARLGVISVEAATKALAGLSVAIKGVGTVTISTRSALDLFNETAARAFGKVKVEADDLTSGIRAAFGTVNEVLTGRFREAAEGLVEQFAKGKIAGKAFADEIRALASLQGSFVDVGPLNDFIRIAGLSRKAVGDLRVETVDAFRTIGNVLKGEFRKSADELVKKFGEARIGVREFRAEIAKLAGLQLGFDDIFRGVGDLAANFAKIKNEGKAAAGVLGTELRASVAAAKAEFDAGKISLDQYLDAVLKTGESLKTFKSLSDDQLVSFEKLRKENDKVASTVLDLSKTLDTKLRPAFDTLLQAFRAGRLNADQLGVGLGRLVAQQRELAEATRETTKTLTEAAGAEAEFFAEIDKGFASLEAARKGFAGTQAGAKLLDEGLGSLVPKVEQLRNRTSEAGRALLDKLLDGFAKGRLGAKDLREELQRLADATVNVGKAAKGAGGNVQQAFAGGGGIGAFGGKPGGIGFGAGSLNGFGIQGRVTGSSNFTSQLESQLGQALGLKPKALRERASRSGGIEGLAQEIGLQRFADGGRVDKTGALMAEAGEFVLSRRGLSDLGTVFAEMLNKGGAAGGFSQVNNFNVSAPETERFGSRALAFALQPALMQVSQLAASRSPIV